MMVGSGSAYNLSVLLTEIIEFPEKFLHLPITHALSSQGKLANFEDEKRGIASHSLNTLKRQASLLAGGFDELERLRLNAKERLAAESRRSTGAKPTTRAALKLRSDALASSLQSADHDLLLLSRMLQLSMAQGRSYAEDSRNPAVKERCRREQLELLHMMTLVKTPTHKPRVVAINGKPT